MNRFYTTDDMAKAAGLKTYDPALPQDWVDMVCKVTSKTMLDIVSAGFVWLYDDSPMFGEPYPLTVEAQKIMKQISATPRRGFPF